MTDNTILDLHPALRGESNPPQSYTVTRKPVPTATAKETLESDTTPEQSPSEEKEEYTLEEKNPYVFEKPPPSKNNTGLSSAPSDTRHLNAIPQRPSPQWKKSVHQFSESLKNLYNTRRKLVISLLVALVVCILALGIGLGVGLKKHNSPQNLPLPTDTTPHTGDLTYYAPGLGACGITSSSSDHIVAISEQTFDAASRGNADPNANPLCGLMLRATRFNADTNQQVSVDLKVVDRCTGCKPADLDTTTAVFELMAPIASGRVTVSWAWLEKVPGIAE